MGSEMCIRDRLGIPTRNCAGEMSTWVSIDRTRSWMAWALATILASGAPAGAGAATGGAPDAHATATNVSRGRTERKRFTTDSGGEGDGDGVGAARNVTSGPPRSIGRSGMRGNDPFGGAQTTQHDFVHGQAGTPGAGEQ